MPDSARSDGLHGRPADGSVSSGSEAALPLDVFASVTACEPMARPARRLARWARSYDTSGERPLVGYVVLLAAYASLVASVVVGVRRHPDRLPLRARDVLLGAVAVFRISRLLTKDSVTAALRAPWTVFEGPGDPGDPGEVNERPRRGPVRHAVGELLTCPFCMGQWAATAWVGAVVVAPTSTRVAGQTLAVASAADVLQHVSVRLARPSH